MIGSRATSSRNSDKTRSAKKRFQIDDEDRTDQLVCERERWGRGIDQSRRDKMNKAAELQEPRTKGVEMQCDMMIFLDPIRTRGFRDVNP
jgi:hypothetical protein